MVAAALAASSAVAAEGIIGLVGLIVPHMLRMIFGPDHKMLIPLCLTFGAAFMVMVDDFARAGLAFEIPVGVLTTIIGAPVFAYLLRTTRARGALARGATGKDRPHRRAAAVGGAGRPRGVLLGRR